MDASGAYVMVCRYAFMSCTRCEKYLCTATHPSKRIGFRKMLEGTICVDDVPDCPLYEDAIVIEAQWIEELEEKGIDIGKWVATHDL